jgi:type II secretory pathway pseudopilin PulG
MEIMMVVGIIGLVMTMGVPGIMRMQSQEPMRKAVNGVMEICSHARAQAILRGQTTVVTFHPQAGRVEFGGTAPANSASAVEFGPEIAIEMLDINPLEYKDSDEARVRFFPNGTCDEMTLILRSGDQWQKISLELTTALAFVETVR